MQREAPRARWRGKRWGRDPLGYAQGSTGVTPRGSPGSVPHHEPSSVFPGPTTLYRVSTAVPKPGLRHGQMARGTQTPVTRAPTHQAVGQSALAPVSSSGRCQSQCPSHGAEQGCILVQRRNAQPASCLAPAGDAPLEAANPARLSHSHGQEPLLSFGREVCRECRSWDRVTKSTDRGGKKADARADWGGTGSPEAQRGWDRGHHIPLWPLTLFPD